MPIEGNYNSTLSGSKLFEARKARREYYRCGKKYFIGHQCKDKQLNTLSGITGQEEKLEDSVEKVMRDLQIFKK